MKVKVDDELMTKEGFEKYAKDNCKVNAEDIVFLSDDGDATTLVEFMDSLLKAVRILKHAIADPLDRRITGNNDKTQSLTDYILAQVYATDHLHARLDDLERKINKPH